MAAIRLDGVSKTFASGRGGVRDVTLDIADGELVVLVGPSGSGKSTTLRLIAGLEQPSAGRIFVGDRDVTDVPPNERDLAMVFQTYALYPHKSVRENLAFGLRMRGAGRDVIDARVAQAAETLQITELLDRKPSQLSGGQRQRVAVGRAIVREPQAFLFDEPLSNLDPALRLDTRTELALLHRRLRATIVYVTHDQEEAMTLGQRIVVMRDGRVEQVDSPMHLYRRPLTVFVGRFIGSPPMNIVEGRATADGIEVPALGASFLRSWGPPSGGPGARTGGRGFSPGLAEAEASALRTDSRRGGSSAPPAPGDTIRVGIRPHDIEMVGEAEADVVAQVSVVEPLGNELHVHVRIEPAGVRLTVVAPADTQVAFDDRIGLRFRRDRLHVFAAGDATAHR